MVQSRRSLCCFEVGTLRESAPAKFPAAISALGKAGAGLFYQLAGPDAAILPSAIAFLLSRLALRFSKMYSITMENTRRKP